MSDPSFAHDSLEPERYEFSEPAAYHFDFDRREFFQMLGGGLAVFCLARMAPAAQESGGARRGFDERLPQEVSAWLHIAEDGAVTVFTGKVEMGQNIRTSLTQAVAEELRVAPGVIRLVMGETDLTPFDMGTFGSRTTPTMSPQLRRASAAARDWLADIAAQDWKVDPSRLVAVEGRIRDSEGKREISYGELVKGRQLAKAIPAEDPLTPANEWKVMGAPLAKVGGREFVTGKHRYTPDLKLPGMLYGKILRPAAFGATLASLDAHQAEALPGVAVVHDGDFVGVAAPTPELAAQALTALHAEWKTSPQISSQQLFEYLKTHAEEARGWEGNSRHIIGSMEQGLASADLDLKQTYTVAYIAHAPLEPRAAVAEWRDGKVTVWTGTQRPVAVRGEVAQAFRIPEDHVRVEVPDTGAA